MLARELMYCTFNPLVGDNMERCSANQSVAFYWSFIGNNQESIFCESPFRPKNFSNHFFPHVLDTFLSGKKQIQIYLAIMDLDCMMGQ
jgi:hypothetical protein